MTAPVSPEPTRDEQPTFCEHRKQAEVLGLKPDGRGRWTHICERCGHPSHRHTLTAHASQNGPYECCDCGCLIVGGNEGFWLSIRDAEIWEAR